MLELLTLAYGVEGDRVFGPAWIGDFLSPNRYVIDATMPANTDRAQFELMMQNLLVERFHLAVHHETRNFPGYNLLVAKDGPKLKETAQDPNAVVPDTRLHEKRASATKCRRITAWKNIWRRIFRTARGKTQQLTERRMSQPEVYLMIRRRAAGAGIKTLIACHTFRATGITAYFKKRVEGWKSRNRWPRTNRRGRRGFTIAATMTSRLTGSSGFSLKTRGIAPMAVRRIACRFVPVW